MSHEADPEGEGVLDDLNIFELHVFSLVNAELDHLYQLYLQLLMVDFFQDLHSHIASDHGLELVSAQVLDSFLVKFILLLRSLSVFIMAR